ncbi:MAG TPA: energy transducer TonB [Polyangiaceae bacterium]|nr:energy transducer TonB [Polyangiaceae bacterium]
MKSRARSIRAWIVGGSVALHAALAVAAVLIPKPERAEAAAIELADIKKKKEPPKPPPPPPPPPPDKPKPPPPPQHAQAQAKAAPEAAKAEATPQAMPMSEDGFADLGSVALGGGGGGDGVAIPTAAGARAAAVGNGAGAPKAVTKKAVQQLAAAGPDACNQPVVRPKRTVGVQPKYTKEAQLAEIEGKVRVEVTVDETGHVISARLVSGLGYGLDEAAIEAAKKCVFEPATACGKPVVGTAVVALNFELE